MKNTTFQSVLIAVVVTLIFAFGLPIGFSLANHRTAVHSNAFPVRFYDTSLDTSTLSPELFRAIVNMHERYSTNDLVRLYGFLFERRLQILAIDTTDSGYSTYKVRVYTYFNIPIETYSASSYLDWIDSPLREF